MGCLRPTGWISRRIGLEGARRAHGLRARGGLSGARSRPMNCSVRQGKRRGLAPARLLHVIQVLLELAEGEAVDHAPVLDPGPSRLRNAVLHEAESPLIVGICVDGDADACSYSLADVGSREVETVHVGVELQGRVRGCGLLYNA